MMVLCPNHHDKASKGALTEEQQRRAKQKPHNQEQGVVRGDLAINQSEVAVAVGTMLLVDDGSLLTVDDEPLLSLGLDEEKVLQLSVTLRDRDDNLLAEIRDNEWVAGSPLPWDIESDYQRLVVRSKAHGVALKLDARQIPLRLTGELWRYKHRIGLRGDGLRFDGTKVENARFSNHGLVRVGIDVQTSTGGGIQIKTRHPDDTRWVLVSESDPARRLVQSLQAFHQLKSGERPPILR
jgi:hypothetical protein